MHGKLLPLFKEKITRTAGALQAAVVTTEHCHSSKSLITRTLRRQQERGGQRDASHTFHDDKYLEFSIRRDSLELPCVTNRKGFQVLLSADGQCGITAAHTSRDTRANLHSLSLSVRSTPTQNLTLGAERKPLHIHRN